ncbi:MAG: quinolinate synthase [Hyphomicrobiaceae bacterium]|jgi:quinolinate synthase
MIDSVLRRYFPIPMLAQADQGMQAASGGPSTFPSLLVRADGLSARGSFAEAQAVFLDPDQATVQSLDALLTEKQIGVVAHFYMDAELQGVLAACSWPHIAVSDSLAMADSAVAMVEQGAKTIVVLGVDFMSENVRAMLDAAGHTGIPVYRLASEPIGCSLAEAAEADAYRRWLENAAASGPALHVVYINTSLAVKARAQSIIPTITCTSSNVVRTILQAWAQLPELNIWYGPDTYMGENLWTMFEAMCSMDDEAIARIHPAHNRATIRAALKNFHWFEEGACIVHHMFGADVVRRVRRDHADAFVTAHFEVPGEMFALGFEAQQQQRGVVGSTSNILDFINKKVDDAPVPCPTAQRLSFILGTEAGMITPIVNGVRDRLKARKDDLAVEIIFPVAAEAIAQTGEEELAVVPGVASGEGCSIAGGCATCPFMKMNSLDALTDLIARVDHDAPSALVGFRPRIYEETVAGQTVSELGSLPILHMRAFQKSGALSDTLTADIAKRATR